MKKDFDLDAVLTSFAIEARNTMHSKAFMYAIFMPTLLLRCFTTVSFLKILEMFGLN